MRMEYIPIVPRRSSCLAHEKKQCQENLSNRFDSTLTSLQYSLVWRLAHILIHQAKARNVRVMKQFHADGLLHAQDHPKTMPAE